MDVYISEEYVMKRRAERKAARDAAARVVGAREAARADGGEPKQWTGVWAETSQRRTGSDTGAAAAAAGCSVVEDVVFSYLSA